MRQVVSAIMAFFVSIWSSLLTFCANFVNDYAFEVDFGSLSEILPNVKSNINNYGGRFPEYPEINERYDPYEFVDYIQLMECTGGNSSRDLFLDPDDSTVLDDYDFSPLISSCRGILKTGAKPLLKLGNVPAKLSRDAIARSGLDTGDFDVNIYPPDDYGEYYDYICAVARALVGEFTLEEVRTWRFGVMTEYENRSWFMAPSGDPAQTAEAYCKLYDYTVQALIDVIGADIFVGAHSMTCSEGLWDEREFIRHCGTGTNYATGETGTRICYLSSSYYEGSPGNVGGTLSIAQITELLRSTAEEVGLTDLIYGVDEGRILCGTRSGSVDSQLVSRTVGFTYQAAFDARLVKEMFDAGMNYFSSWDYCSFGNSGLPMVSCHVAANAAKFGGMNRASVTCAKQGRLRNARVECVAGCDPENRTALVMAYNYKNSLDYLFTAETSYKLKVPFITGGTAEVAMYVIDDDCNWFDEWNAVRDSLGVTDDKFAWSPDDGCPNFSDPEAAAVFRDWCAANTKLAQLEPEVFTAEVKNGEIALEADLAPNAVVFFEISE
ncbi:MAG: hypothetical protein K6C36_08030 [Clostridia bacterium]|nr:hypothetical protein [Clostridia bacterium]